jgi:biotin carboxyl carrier protein
MARTTTYFAKDLLEKGAEAVPVEVEALSGTGYAVTMNGTRYELDSVVLPHGAVSMIIDGDSYSVEFDEKGDEVAVLLRGQVMRFDIADERRLRMRSVSATFSVEGRQTVTAPMPGRIVKVFVEPGQAVTEGQGLLVVEAMKMENEIKSPKAGTVLEVCVKDGATVENGAKLLVVE